MLATLSTLMILTVASFAVIATGMTIANSWNLIVAALNVSSAPSVSASQRRRAAARRTIKVSVRAPSGATRAAA